MEPMCSGKYKNRIDMMTFFFVKDLRPRTPSIDAVFEEEGGQKDAKPGFAMVLLDGHPRQNTILKFRVEAKVSWTNGLLFVHHIIRQERYSIQQVEAIRLRNIANTSTTFL